MRYLLIPLSLALFLSACTGSTKNNTGTPVNTRPIELLMKYEDFSPTMSSDGKRAAFISLRSEPDSRVYLYDESAAEKVFPLTSIAATDSGEQEWLASISPDGNWVLAYREKAGSAGRILLHHFSGTAEQSISLPENTLVEELLFSPDNSVFAVVQRAGSVRTLRTFAFSGDGTTVTTQEMPSFEKKSHARFAMVSNVLQLLVLDESSSTSRTVQKASYDAANKVFATFADAGTVDLFAAAKPLELGPNGLLSVTKLETAKQKALVGTADDLTTRAVPYENVIQQVNQLDVFAQSTPYDFSAATYVAEEPLTVSSLSLSSDGEYMLATSNDSVYCKAGARVITFYRLIRRSDMTVLPISVSRVTGTTAWTSVQVAHCSLVDSTEANVASDFDRSGYSGKIVGVNGNEFLIMVESIANGDREIRLLKFTVDWTAKTLSDTSITEISSNLRP